MPAMPATFDAVVAVIFLSAISLLAVVAVALAAFVETGSREDRAAAYSPQITCDVGAHSKAVVSPSHARVTAAQGLP